MKGFLRNVFAVALLAALPQAHATTAQELTVEQQAKKAQVIVRARLGTPQGVKAGETSWTVYPLEILETVAGDAAALPQLEGKPALYTLAGLQDLPPLRSGQEAVFLLYTARFDSPLVGFNQGYYPLEGGRVRLGWAQKAAGAPATTPDTVGLDSAEVSSDTQELDPFRERLRTARGAYETPASGRCSAALGAHWGGRGSGWLAYALGTAAPGSADCGCNRRTWGTDSRRGAFFPGQVGGHFDSRLGIWSAV
ncbi:hypothetical protein ACFP81_00350 [Deinococcus lacus]|uniref:Uncharacterized protein n=1 Tax=Deinococcus lacus TaxID=392561 RepID=A0ABW1Y8J3_9DEIO